MARKKKQPDYYPLTYGVRPAPSIPTHITVSQGIDSRKWADEGMWVPVLSSNVREIKYDKKDSTLYIFFQSGRTWRYSNVPPSVAEMCFNVNSPGRFEWRVLRKSYPAVEVFGVV